jgi:hypothetical protein
MLPCKTGSKPDTFLAVNSTGSPPADLNSGSTAEADATVTALTTMVASRHKPIVVMRFMMLIFTLHVGLIVEPASALLIPRASKSSSSRAS